MSLKVNRPIAALGVGLIGFLTFLPMYPLAQSLGNVTGAVMGCLDEAYAIGCGALGLYLAPPVCIFVAALVLSLFYVRGAVFIVLVSSIALFGVYMITGTWINETITPDNSFAYYLGFATLQGLFFALMYSILSSRTRQRLSDKLTNATRYLDE